MVRIASILSIPFLHYWILPEVHSADVPANDLCFGAIELPQKGTSVSLDGNETLILGSTWDASLETLSFCGENFVNSPGLWYVFENTNDETIIVTVSTCTEYTMFDTALTVYTGSDCESRTCLHGIDDDYECSTGIDVHSTIAFHAQPFATSNQRYYVLVHGSQSNHTGEFGLRVSLSEPLGSSSTASPSSGTKGQIFSTKTKVLVLFGGLSSSMIVALLLY
eukprot:Nitzschia sp. Nitz4//scaffold21_size171442//59119//59784//NITZ4_002158-RA/size171442-processed-gene-0.47-mRNA-1//-1//CDS//3329542402//3410//frame0